VLGRDQLLFLQRSENGRYRIHVARDGESLYDICQSEGLRYEDLLQMNQLKDGDQPAVGEKIWLKNFKTNINRHVPSSGYTIKILSLI